MSPQSAVIAGAGIAGLAAALGLARAGLKVEIADRRDALSEVGAGLQLSPNALKALDWLGLADKALALATRPDALVVRRYDDAGTLTSIPAAKIEAAYGAPYATLHRAELQALLVKAVADHPAITLHLDTQLIGFGGGTALTTTDHTLTGDICVVADGVHSQMRPYIAGFDPPRFGHEIAYRGLIPADRLDGEGFLECVTVAMGPGMHLVAYPVQRGRALNLVVITREHRWPDTDWSAMADRDAFCGLFKKWAGPFQRLAGAVEGPTRWALYERAVPKVWSTPDMVLIGDAAHAMLPHQAQGAALALEDAVVLARLIEAGGSLPAFGDLRARRCGQMQAAARRNGRLFQIGPAPLTHARNFALSQILRVRPDFLLNRFDAAWSYDPASTTLAVS